MIEIGSRARHGNFVVGHSKVAVGDSDFADLHFSRRASLCVTALR